MTFWTTLIGVLAALLVIAAILGYGRRQMGCFQQMLFVALGAMAVVAAVPEHGYAGTVADLGGGFVEFAGEITQADVPRIKSAILASEKSSPQWLVLGLDSPGGDVMAAMEIGRFVRQNAVSTEVPSTPGARCYSACVLIVMGGVRRIAPANLGIHRPRFDESYFAGLTESEARVEYQKLSAMVEAYLAEMGADPSLFQQMMRVSSGQNRLLTMEEANSFAINGSTPSYQELEACEQSQEYKSWMGAYSSRLLPCIGQQNGRACFAEMLQRFPDPCASFRKRP